MKNATTKLVDNAQRLILGLQRITQQEMLVGIPSCKNARKEEGPLNNATLGYIHDNGAPEANIPARPWMKPGIKDAAPKIKEQFKLAARATMDGQVSVNSYLNRAGLVAQNAMRAKINEGIPPPLAESTLAARRRKGFKGTKPLIRTAQLRNSITYILRKVK